MAARWSSPTGKKSSTELRTRPRTDEHEYQETSSRAGVRGRAGVCDRRQRGRGAVKVSGVGRDSSGPHRPLGWRARWRYAGSREIREEPGADDSLHAAWSRALQERRHGKKSERLLPAARPFDGAYRAV